MSVLYVSHLKRYNLWTIYKLTMKIQLEEVEVYSIYITFVYEQKKRSPSLG